MVLFCWKNWLVVLSCYQGKIWLKVIVKVSFTLEIFFSFYCKRNSVSPAMLVEKLLPWNCAGLEANENLFGLAYRAMQGKRMSKAHFYPLYSLWFYELTAQCERGFLGVMFTKKQEYCWPSTAIIPITPWPSWSGYCTLVRAGLGK